MARVGIDIAAYLRRLGLDDDPARVPPPSADWLTRLHRAHVARVPYENLTIQLGRPHGIHRDAAVGRVLAGSGGYCFHLNGSFARLLGALGFDVRRHLAGVQPPGSPAPVGATGNHLALTVHGLPTPAEPAGAWLVDVGLGDGPADPLPLRAGQYAQGPFRYTLESSATVSGGWRFGHDLLGSFVGFDMAGDLAPAGGFVDMHAYLSTSPDSPFVQRLVVQRRHATGADRLRGCVFERVSADGVRGEDVATADEWFAILADVFGLTLDDADRDERAALWQRTWRAHAAWREAEVTA